VGYGVPVVPVEKPPCWNRGTVSVRRIENAKLLILLLLLVVVVVVVEKECGENRLGSKVPVIFEWFPFCKFLGCMTLLILHRVVPLFSLHSLGSPLLKNAGTLEPWNRTSKKPCKSSTYTVPIFSKNCISLDRETLNSVLGLELYQIPPFYGMQGILRRLT